MLEMVGRPQGRRWPRSPQHFEASDRLTGGISSSQTCPGQRPKPAPHVCELWTGRRRAASVSAPCAGGACVPAAAAGLWPAPCVPSWSKCWTSGVGAFGNCSQSSGKPVAHGQLCPWRGLVVSPPSPDIRSAHGFPPRAPHWTRSRWWQPCAVCHQSVGGGLLSRNGVFAGLLLSVRECEKTCPLET